MRKLEVLFNPCNEMILECSLDCLVEEVWGEKFVYICSWKVGRERLTLTVSTRLVTWERATYEEVRDNSVTEP